MTTSNICTEKPLIIQLELLPMSHLSKSNSGRLFTIPDPGFEPNVPRYRSPSNEKSSTFDQD